MLSRRFLRRCFLGCFLIVALAATFVYGVGVGKFRWFPHDTLAAFKHTDLPSLLRLSEYQGEEELLGFAFTKPVIKGEMLLPPIKTLEDIRKTNDSIFLPVEHFFDAYRNIRILADREITLNASPERIKALAFELGGREYDAYAYFAEKEAGERKRAVLIIPGSGLNQSSGIFLSDSRNYHYDIMCAFPNDDVYVFIKPNEDAYAFHRGARKLQEDFIVNWHLNRGSSYSAAYIAQSIAFSKFLKTRYTEVVVAGLSQGGGAALLNALQSEPDYAIVASGFSMINKITEWSSFGQIVIPNIGSTLDSIADPISKLQTHFLFTWGKQEIGTYRIEAMERISAQKLEKLQNVTTITHSGGHIFPVEAIVRFLSGESTE